MKLYNGLNYCNLSLEDLKRYDEIQAAKKIGLARSENFRLYPKAIRHYEHLFPNNYMDFVELHDSTKIEKMHKEFLDLLDGEAIEREVLNFINKNEYYFLIASIFTLYDFGHHEAYLFKEFNIGDHVVDYLLIGKKSGGYQFIFVELEDPCKNCFLKTFGYGKSLRDGLTQVRDWKMALNQNFGNFTMKIRKAIKPGAQLPEEFLINDESRRHYVVVAGRRAHYDLNSRKANEIRRSENLARILHYDNLADRTFSLIGRNSF